MGFAFLLEVVRHILSKSLPSSIYRTDGFNLNSLDSAALEFHWVYSGLGSKTPFLRQFSHVQLSVLLREWIHFLEKMRPTPKKLETEWTHMQKGATMDECAKRWKLLVRGIYEAMLTE